MKRISLVVAAMLSLALIGGGCAHITPRLTQGNPSTGSEQITNAAPVGVLGVLNGSATVTRGTETVLAAESVELLPGDTVKVATGTAVIAYPGAGASYLEAGTEVTLLPDGEGEGSVFTQIELTAGSIWTRFERLLGADERFSVSGNGVVATVRGTAFGMEMDGEEVDIQVADHEIDVSMLDARRDSKLLKKTMRLKNGEGLKIGVKAMLRLEAAGIKKLVRTLTAKDKQRKGFKQMAEPVPENLMKMKAGMRMKSKATIPEQFRERVEFMINSGFMAPDRGVLPGEFAPTSTPSATMETSATMEIR